MSMHCVTQRRINGGKNFDTTSWSFAFDTSYQVINVCDFQRLHHWHNKHRLTDTKCVQKDRKWYILVLVLHIINSTHLTPEETKWLNVLSFVWDRVVCSAESQRNSEARSVYLLLSPKSRPKFTHDLVTSPQEWRLGYSCFSPVNISEEFSSYSHHFY